MRINNIFDFKLSAKKNKVYNIVIWSVLCLAIITVFSLHEYNDILITGKQSMKFWDLLCAGKPFQFYSESIMVSGNPYYPVEQGAGYPLTFYLIFAVWNLPIWILEKITELNIYNSIAGMLWTKSVLLLFLSLSAYEIYKIVSDTRNNKKESLLAAFLFLSSLSVFSCVCVAGQYEIITIYFILIGFRGWLKKDNARFIVSFAFAITLKYFALMFFVPLLLLDEKKIFSVIKKGILAFSPSIVLFLIIKIFSGKTSGSNAGGMIEKFTAQKISVGNMEFSPFIAVTFLVLLCCFLSQEKTEINDRFSFGIFYLSVLSIAFCILADIHPYWSILALPVLCLGFFSVINNQNKLLISETVFELCLTLYFFVKFNWVYGIKTIGAMGILPRILGVEMPSVDNAFAPISVLVRFADADTIKLLSLTVALVAGGLFVYYLWPNRKENKILEPINNWTVLGRMFINIGIGIFPAFCSMIYLLYK